MRNPFKREIPKLKEAKVLVEGTLEPLPPSQATVGALMLAFGTGFGVPVKWVMNNMKAFAEAPRVFIINIQASGPVRSLRGRSVVGFGRPKQLLAELTKVEIPVPPSTTSAGLISKELRFVSENALRYDTAMVAVVQVQPQASLNAVFKTTAVGKRPWEGKDAGPHIPGRRLAVLLSSSDFGKVVAECDGARADPGSCVPRYEYGSAVYDEDLTTVIYLANLDSVANLVLRHELERLKVVRGAFAVGEAEGEGQGGHTD